MFWTRFNLTPPNASVSIFARVQRQRQCWRINVGQSSPLRARNQEEYNVHSMISSPSVSSSRLRALRSAIFTFRSSSLLDFRSLMLIILLQPAAGHFFFVNLFGPSVCLIGSAENECPHSSLRTQNATVSSVPDRRWRGHSRSKRFDKELQG